MRSFAGVGARRALVLALVLVMSSYVTHAVRTTPSVLGVGPAGKATTSEGGNRYGDQAKTFHQERSQAAPEGEEEEQLMLKERAVTGSRLPDCTHACGPCSPCKRVMVSFRCAEAAESCPIAYRCMCRGRFFPVPTL